MSTSTRPDPRAQPHLGGAVVAPPRRWSPSSRWLLVPPLVFVAVLFGYPLLEMVRQSVTDFVEPGGGPFANYVWFLTDETQLTILFRTFVVSALVVLGCLLLGFPYAYLMTRVGPNVRLLLLAAILLPFWTSLIVRLYAWVILLQPSGPILSGLNAVGVTDVRLLGTSWGVAFGSIQVLVPFMVLTLYASLSVIDRRLLDAAQSLGATPRAAFVRVYLPLAVPGVLAGSTIVFVFMLGFYFTPAFLGSTQNSLVAQQIVAQISRLLAIGRGSAMALVLLMVTLLLLGLAAWATRRLTLAVAGGRSDD